MLGDQNGHSLNILMSVSVGCLTEFSEVNIFGSREGVKA